jgi:hypothetical protein
MSSDDMQEIQRLAYEAYEAGRLKEAASHFATLLRDDPDYAAYHYMQGLVHKYLRDWPVSLHHNLRSQALHPEPDEASIWNAAIAATGMSDWAEARRQWKNCGIALPDGEGPTDGDFGAVCIRLNAWSDGETLSARRIDPVRARLQNGPFPESGYRYGDIVLHDGAKTGSRNYHGTDVPVFNAMQLLQPSGFETFSVFITCGLPADVEALFDLSIPDIGSIEDWTQSVIPLCRRCSYGIQHSHEDKHDSGAWEPERSIGIAALNRQAVEQLLARWKGPGRSVEGIESGDFPVPEPEDGCVWWLSPDDEEESVTS